MCDEDDLDPFVPCPYDAVHQIPLSRLQKHIVKCEKNYPTYKICPYNATHRFPPDKMKAHVDTCPSKDLIFTKKTDKVTGKITKPAPILQRQYLKETDPEFEDWDE